MNEQVVVLLHEIVGELGTISSYLDDVNRGIAMLLEKSDVEVVDKLDDIAGGVEDINLKLGPSSAIHSSLDAMQQTLNELPAEIAAGVNR